MPNMADLERRIRAAQELGGFRSLDDLAAAIGRESNGMSRKTLRRIASDTDSRTAKDYELAWIAEACRVPVAFLEQGPVVRAGQPDLYDINQKLDRNFLLLEKVLAKLGVKDWEEAEGLRVPGFPAGIAELLRPPADTPPRSEAEEA